MNQPTDADSTKWHRYFAVESNNEAWQSSLEPVEQRDVHHILAHAYTAAVHWAQCGTELNTFRANILLAHAHAFCGHGTTALEYAVRCRHYMSEHDVEGWEKVFVAMIYAQAAWSAGDSNLHARLYAEAAVLIESIQDPADREVADLTWANIPRP